MTFSKIFDFDFLREKNSHRKNVFRIFFLVFIFLSHIKSNPCKWHHATPPVPPANASNAPSKITKIPKIHELAAFWVTKGKTDCRYFLHRSCRSILVIGIEVPIKWTPSTLTHSVGVLLAKAQFVIIILAEIEK